MTNDEDWSDLTNLLSGWKASAENYDFFNDPSFQ